MNTLELLEPSRLEIKAENIIHMPEGLLGFEDARRFVLLSHPSEDPLMWLRMLDQPRASFLVVPSFLVLPDYQPDIPDEDAALLGLLDPDDALVLNIVTLHPDGEATANLKGPIIVNRHTLRAKQVVLMNGGNWALQHPLSLTK
jgi:flagellar assembly factor FliW